MASRDFNQAFESDMRMQVESIRYPRKLLVTNRPDDTVPGHIAFEMRREGLPHRRRFFLTTEDALELGKFLQRITEGS